MISFDQLENEGKSLLVGDKLVFKVKGQYFIENGLINAIAYSCFGQLVDKQKLNTQKSILLENEPNKKVKKETLKPTSETLAKMDLKYGRNELVYSFPYTEGVN